MYFTVDTFNFIDQLFKESKWFIAGSSLTTRYYRDIDVFFYDKESYDKASEAMVSYFNKPQRNTLITKSTNAVTYEIKDELISLINMHFGPPKQILDKMDLNRSAIAILPDRSIVKSKDFDKPLTIRVDNIGCNTFSRYIKYYHREIIAHHNSNKPINTLSYKKLNAKKPSLNLCKALVYAVKSDYLVTNYYDVDKPKIPINQTIPKVNKFLYEGIDIKDFYYSLLLKYRPEDFI